MKNWQRATMVLAMIAFAGCGDSDDDASRETAQSRAQDWAQANDGEPLEIQLSGSAVIGCPQSVVCDESFDYRAFLVAEQGLRLRLSFDGVLASAISLELLEEHFNVASLSYAPPELQSERWDFQLGGDVALRADEQAVTFTGWESGRAQGEIQITLSGLVGRVKEYEDANPDCFMMDAPLPAECTVEADVEVPLHVTFDLELPTGTQDCQSSPSAPGCGGSIPMN